MIAGGLFILIILIVAWACRHRKANLTLNLAVGCGLLLGFWIWLGLWAAGSYLVGQAIDSGRVETTNNQCDDVTVGLATFFIMLVWFLFLGLCLKKVATLLLTKKKVGKEEEEEDMGHQEVSDHLFP